MSEIQREKLIESIGSSLQLFLRLTRRNGRELELEVERFLAEIKPDVYELLVEAAAGRPVAAQSVELFADATVARAARASLAFTHAERAALAAIVAAAVRGALTAALAL